MNVRWSTWQQTRCARSCCPRFASPREELEFLDELEQGLCRNAVQLYGLWREQEGRIRAAYEALDKKISSGAGDSEIARARRKRR